jgi:phosphoglycerol transferase MdoB-like AlkP superfamily enzyme
MGTLLAGTLIKDEVIYSYFMNRVKDYPHLIHFLNQQGYHTFALQPLNRTRPGYTLTSYEKFYQYKTYLNFEDLDFDGPAFGFRNIPDQYSLNYAYETYLKPASSPLFLFFLTVSSHSPWIDLPPYLKDWRSIKDQSQLRLAQKYSRTENKLRESFLSHFSGGIGLNEYLQHMIYELRMIQNFILTEAPENSLVIVIGDHQPPITVDPDPDFNTPLHIISQDEKFIHSFEPFGFVRGLNLDQGELQGIRHEGFYSLLIHILSENYAEQDSLPPYLENGIPLSITR